MRDSLNGLEKNKNRKILKNSKGITLIALIITVVVMLILAGVVISSIVGENNLFSKIGNAKNIYENESLKEANLLTSMADEIEDEMYGMVEKVTDTAPGILEGEFSRIFRKCKKWNNV